MNNALTNIKGRSFVSAKLARRIEEACGLETLWLDQQRASPRALASKIALLNVRARLALESVVNVLIDKQTQ